MANSRLFTEEFLRRLEHLALMFKNSAASQNQGERRSSKRGQSVEFADFRPYSLGDDFRRIDWNAYARLEKLFIKLFVEEDEITVHLLIDNSYSMDWGRPKKLDYAVQIAGAVGYIALINMDRVSAAALHPPGERPQRLSPVRGKKSALTLFDFLSSIQPSRNQGDLHRYFAVSIDRSPGICLLISDLMNDFWKPFVGLIRSQGHELTIIHTLAADEISPDFYGDYRLLDNETDSEVEITADYETLADYQKGLVAWREDWKKYCTSRDIHYIPISNEVALEKLLFNTLPVMGVLR